MAASPYDSYISDNNSTTAFLKIGHSPNGRTLGPNRSAADAYNLDDEDLEIDHPELELLVNALEVGISRANEAVGRAEREVRATLDFYLAREQVRKAHA